MTSEEFIEVIKKVVYKGSVRGAIDILKEPPGREPPKELLELSVFYKSLSEDQKDLLHRIIDLSCEETLFGMLCVLDGVRAIENGEEKGKLTLLYEKGDSKTLLNNPQEDFLHDLI